MNTKEFFKKIEKGNTYFYFTFLGIPKKEDINYEKISELINNCFNEFKLYNDMTRNITWIRTILKDFDEEYLEIRTEDKLSETKQVIYRNKQIKLYKVTKKIEEDYANCFSVEYNLGKELTFSFSESNAKIFEYPIYEKIVDLVNKIRNELYQLNDIKPVELDYDSKKLCEIYKLFYNKYPDFSSKDINLKFQMMMLILKEYGIKLDENISFIMLTSKMPISLYLKDKIDLFRVLGQIESIDNPQNLQIEDKKIIKVIGEIIREYIHDEAYELYVIKKISSIFYASRNCLSPKKTSEEIAIYCNCSKDEVNNTLKLVKKIDNKIYIEGC